jgi:DNA transposition AAA+ family ATPase
MNTQKTKKYLLYTELKKEMNNLNIADSYDEEQIKLIEKFLQEESNLAKKPLKPINSSESIMDDEIYNNELKDKAKLNEKTYQEILSVVKSAYKFAKNENKKINLKVNDFEEKDL